MNNISRLIMTAVALASFAGAASAYTLSVRTGELPANVTVENLNSLMPDSEGYSRGWTKQGWTTDRFGSRGYILVSPTFTGQDRECQNSLSLPALEIAEGDCLSWDARSASPDFKESYIVTVRSEGETTAEAEKIFERSEIEARWESEIIPLDKYVGKKVVIEFRATSTNKFLLCVDKVSVAKPSPLAAQATRQSTMFFDNYDIEHGRVGADFSIKNIGKNLQGALIELNTNGERSAVEITGMWQQGESRSVQIPLPVFKDKRQSYEVWLKSADESSAPVLLHEGVYFCSTFKPYLMVDKGTGQWCVNCPEANILVEQMDDLYGDNLVMLETHNKDMMANEEYFSKLAYNSIPYFMLNRINDSRAGNQSKFDKYVYQPCNWSISLVKADNIDNTRAAVSVNIETGVDIYNSDDRYRVGYVMTTDVYQPGDKNYWQRNGSSQPEAEQFYFLPSTIPAPLNKFHNVTLTYDTAFTGIENSLPTELKSFAPASYSFEIPKPERLENLDNARIVVFVLDTQTGEVMNTRAGRIGQDFSLNSIEDISENTRPINAPAGVYNLQGIRLGESIEGLPPGFYIYNGKKISR